MAGTYHEPLALVIVSSISIGIGALVALWILIDIILRRGWKTMMGIMIPVYVINALYLWPITLWTYLKYGRPSKPSESVQKSCHQESSDSGSPEEGHHSHHKQERPMFATVTIGVCHCGAGCVLGDIIGEWIVYSTGAAIGSPPQGLWVEYLVDFAFAFAFGIVFQYFSIAPMEGQYGPKIVWRALKADALSLLAFEIGLFGWMAIFQIAIFNWELPMNTVTYWWMMQIGMFLGHWTGFPMNWWLIKTGVKSPCA